MWIRIRTIQQLINATPLGRLRQKRRWDRRWKFHDIYRGPSAKALVSSKWEYPSPDLNYSIKTEEAP